MKQQHEKEVRPFARAAARELTEEEIAAIAGGAPGNTHATGPNGDDPADPGTNV
ncbi:hypothetical protein [Marilutibacter alkalisoli]|uniref:hypothetical protein n=1 Tax=Marilutibacter alkalisoli TaxID=2591633 RepID=UPI00141FAD1E|nr:hypothetical protein [Lysobacter alkalisoli]